jgi:hypothetical protein
MEIAGVPTEEYRNDTGVAGRKVGVTGFKVEGTECVTQ